MTLLCVFAKTKPRAYYKWRSSRSEREKRYAEDVVLIEKMMHCYDNELHGSTKAIGKSGYRTIAMDSKEKIGVHINHKKVQRLMRIAGIQAGQRKSNPYAKLKKSGGEHLVAPNLLSRRFNPHLMIPYRIFGTDITFIRITGHVWVYLSVIKDFCTGEVVAWELSKNCDLALALRTLDRFKDAVPLEDRLGGILHSDQGCTYTAKKFQETVRALGINPSMSRRGNCIDNSPTESFFGHLKPEIGQTRKMTFEELRECIEAYILHYNNERRQWDREKLTPVEYRNQFLSPAIEHFDTN